MGFMAYKLKSYYNSYIDLCVISKMFTQCSLAIIYGIGILFDDAGIIFLLSILLVPIMLLILIKKIDISIQQFQSYLEVYSDQNCFEHYIRKLLTEKSDEKYDLIIESFNEIHKSPSVILDKLVVA